MRVRSIQVLCQHIKVGSLPNMGDGGEVRTMVLLAADSLKFSDKVLLSDIIIECPFTIFLKNHLKPRTPPSSQILMTNITFRKMKKYLLFFYKYRILDLLN